MKLVGLTGGVASGKSTVAKMLQRCGAVVIDADALARQAVEPGRPAWREIVKTFGKRILSSDRSIDRKALAAVVFSDRSKLRRLNAIVHPRVAREQRRRLRAIARKNPCAIVVYDVPLLFEAGLAHTVDAVVVVTADRTTQIARLRARNGLSKSEAIRRVRSQLPLAKKAELADYVLDGTKPRSRLRADVRRLYRKLRASA